MSKKALTWGVVVSAILWSMSAAFVVAPLTARAADVALASGDLIRGTVKSPYGGYPVFYYGVDGKKSLFSTEATYKTWYSDFSSVKVLSQTQLESIPSGDKNVTYRPGVHVVKFESESNLYVVEKGAVIRKISDAVAKEIYGATYVASMIQSAFRANYKSGADVVVAADHNKAAAMAASPSISVDMGGAAVVVPVGALSVSLASDNPAGAVLPKASAGVTLMKFNLASGSGATVTGLTAKRVGVGATADFSNMYLYDGAKRLTTGRSIQSTTNEVQFTSLNVMIAAGATKTLALVGDVAIGATSGDTHGFSVTALTSAAAVSGTPVTGSTFSIGSQAVSAVTVQKGATPSNPTVGTKGATISEFKLVAGTNDVKVSRVTVIQSGTIPNGDLANLELWQGGAKIASVAAMDGDKMRFVLDAPLTIPQGTTRVFNVKADVTGYGSRTIITYVEYASDVYAMDTVYNFGACVDQGDTSCTTAAAAGTFNSANTISVTTQGGKATIAFNGPSAADISTGSQDALLYKFSITAGDQALDMRNVRATIAAVNGSSGTSYLSTTNDTSGAASSTQTVLYTDIALKNMDTGARIDTKEITTTGNVTSFALVYNNSFVIPAGKTVNLAITADVKNTTHVNLVNQKVLVTLAAFSLGDVKEINTNQNVALADIVPSGTSTIAGYNMTIKASALTVQLASTPVSSSTVKGSTGVEMTGFSVAAGTQSDVKVTSIKVTGSASVNSVATSAAQTGSVILSATLWDGSTQIGTAKSPDATLGTMTFDNLNWTVPAGQTKKLVVKVNVATSITGLSSVNATAFVGIAAAADIAAQDKDSNSVTATDGDSTWSNPINTGGSVLLTVKNTGTLTLEVDGDTAKSTIIVGGTSDVAMAKFKFSPTDESFWIKKLRISNDSSADDTGITQVKLTYPKQDLTMETKTAVLSAGVADIADMNFYAPVNKDSVLTVSVDLGEISAAGVSGDTPTMRIDFNGAFEAVGSQSGASLDEGSDVHAAAGLTACSDGSGVSLCYADTATATGNAMTVRKTKPTVTLASSSPSGAGIPGLGEVLRFTVAADAKAGLDLKAITFKVTSTDNASVATGWNRPTNVASGAGLRSGDFTLYDSTDMSTALVGPTSLSATAGWTLYNSAGTALVNGDTGASNAVAFAEFHFTTAQNISAGASKTFVLKVDTTGASSSADDTVRFDVADEVTISPNFIWNETGPGANTATVTDGAVAAFAGIDGTNVKNLPVTGGTIVY